MWALGWSLAVDERWNAVDEALADDAAQHPGEEVPGVLLGVLLLAIDDPAQRVDHRQGVHHADDQAAGGSHGQRLAHRKRVGQLADEDHVGVLAGDASQRIDEIGRVGPDLALADDGGAVGVEHLDRVLDRHDVTGLRGVDVVDHRRGRGGLPRRSRARDDDQAVTALRQVGDDLRDAEVGDGRSTGDHPPDGEAHGPPLPVDVDAEAAEAGDAVGEVGLARPLELLRLDRREQLGGERLDLLGPEGVERGAGQLAVAPQARRRPDLHEQVRTALLEQVLQQFDDLRHEMPPVRDVRLPMETAPTRRPTDPGS